MSHFTIPNKKADGSATLTSLSLLPSLNYSELLLASIGTVVSVMEREGGEREMRWARGLLGVGSWGERGEIKGGAMVKVC
jgi:hypothetical protein